MLLKTLQNVIYLFFILNDFPNIPVFKAALEKETHLCIVSGIFFEGKDGAENAIVLGFIDVFKRILYV